MRAIPSPSSFLDFFLRHFQCRREAFKCLTLEWEAEAPSVGIQKRSRAMFYQRQAMRGRDEIHPVHLTFVLFTVASPLLMRVVTFQDVVHPLLFKNCQISNH